MTAREWLENLTGGMEYGPPTEDDVLAMAAALRKVLDQHRAAACQRTVPRMLRSTPEDHLPYRPCDGCGEEWPCPTVKAINETLAGDSHTPV